MPGFGLIIRFLNADGCADGFASPRVGCGPLSPRCLSERLPVAFHYLCQGAFCDEENNSGGT